MALEYTVKSTDMAQFSSQNVKLFVGLTEANTGTNILTGNTIKFVCDDGYKFTSAPRFNWNNGGGRNFVLASDSLTASLTVSDATSRGGYKDFNVVTESTVVKAPAYTFKQSDITNALNSNVDMSINNVAVTSGTVWYIGDELILTCTATDYKFKSASVFTEFGESEAFTLFNGNKAAKYTATEVLQAISYKTEYTPFIALEVTQAMLDQLNNITLFIDDVEAVVGSTALVDTPLLFKPKHSYIRIDNLRVQYNGSSVAVTIANNEGKYTTVRNSITGFTSAVTDTRPSIIYTHTQEKETEYLDKHVELFINGVKAVVGDVIRESEPFSLHTLTGWEFMIGEQVLVNDAYGTEMDLNETRTVATINSGEVRLSFSGFIFTTVKSAVVNNDMTNNTYLITPREFRNLESQEFREYDAQGNLRTDYSSLIIGTMRFPFKIPDDALGELQGIYIGSKQFDGVKATDISTDFISIDLGSIEVVGTNKNFKDYLGTTAILRLPHLQSVMLDLEYVIDQTIGVNYLVNLSNGETIVTVSSSAIKDVDKTILTINAVIGSEVPTAFHKGNDYAPMDVDGLRLGGVNDISQPYIDIIRNESVNSDCMFTIPIKDCGELQNVNGWSKINDVLLVSNATKQEKETIINLLKNGVYFNV